MKVLLENWRRFLTEAPGDTYTREQEHTWFVKDPEEKSKEEKSPHEPAVSQKDLDFGRELAADYKGITTGADAKEAGLSFLPIEDDMGHAISIGGGLDEIDNIVAEKIKGRKLAGLVRLFQQIGNAIAEMTTGKEKPSVRMMEIIQQFPVLDKFDLSVENWGAPSEMLSFREHYRRYLAKQVDAWGPDAYSVPIAAVDDINIVFDRWKKRRYAKSSVQESLFENWRGFLNEAYTDWGSVDLDQMSEDDLYDLDYEDLKELEEYIEDFSKVGRQSTVDPKDLLSTVKARIEAIEEGDMEGIKLPADREIEGLYDGEFILKLMKSFFSSANAGIELASMIPGAESLSQEFVLIRHHVANLVEYAEDANDYPWLTLDETEGHPDVLANRVRLLMNQIIKPEEPEGGITEEEQEVIDGYHKFADSMSNLQNYAYYGLHHKAPGHYNSPALSRILPSMGYDQYVNDYKFIKDWLGGEAL
jgi:hypothetical protein